MTISEYITHLEQIKAANGDLEVFQGNTNTTLGCITPARMPQLKEIARLSGREHNARFTMVFDSVEKRSGRIIVYVGR